METNLDPTLAGLVRPYANLISEGLRDESSLQEFALRYVKFFLSDNTMWEDPIWPIIDDVFGRCEEFVPDDADREPHEVSPQELVAGMQRALADLAQLGVHPDA